VELFDRKNTPKIKISASQRISIKNCMNNDHNKHFRLFKFQSANRKLYLNSPKGYSRKIINVQAVIYDVVECWRTEESDLFLYTLL